MVLANLAVQWLAGGLRALPLSDPACGIQWPGEVLVINERDRSYPDVGP